MAHTQNNCPFLRFILLKETSKQYDEIKSTNDRKHKLKTNTKILEICLQIKSKA